MQNEIQKENIKRPKLLYLDGLRGASALFVAIFHAQLYTGHWIERASLAPYLKPFSFIFSLGHLAVPIFIVLSGFCLAIPVALNPAKELNGGFKGYITRRAKRILPPYYFALAFFTLLIYFVPILQVPQNTAWDSKIPLDWESVVSHLFLVHNFSANLTHRIDGPLWSVATEWQLYFLFPMIIYFWKRIGLVSTTFISIFLSLGISAFLEPAKVMHFWFLGLFSIGVLGAAITFSKEIVWENYRTKINWKLASIVSGCIVLAIIVLSEFRTISPKILEIIVGFGVGTFLVYFSLIENQSLNRPLLLRAFNSKFLVNLGVYSYSIYLIHSPLLGLINLLTLNVPMSPSLRWIFMEVIAVPVAISISFIFYYYIERKFMASHQDKIAKKQLSIA